MYGVWLITLVICNSYMPIAGHNKEYLVQQARQYIPFGPEEYLEAEELCNSLDNTSTPSDYVSLLNTQPTCLFEHYPALNNAIAHISIASLPTPVHRLCTLEQSLAIGQLWIKRDDLTAKNELLVGGNKVRKLEFLLADALFNGAQSVMTFGCVASNHALATACYCNLLGLACMVMLKPQPNSHVVRKNLLGMYGYNACMHWSPNIQERNSDSLTAFINYVHQYHTIPYVIPTGGSCPLGIVGYINAAFELKEQINAGLLPEPDYIYAPTGSKGTVTGLLLGLQACGLKSKIVAIATENEGSPGFFKRKIKELFEKTNALLCASDLTFPHCTFNAKDIAITFSCAGKAYGLFTQEGNAAAKVMYEKENIILDGTYTAKAFAGMLEHIHTNDLSGKVALYWHTYDSHINEDYMNIDYHNLAQSFHTYFEKNVQELDENVM